MTGAALVQTSPAASSAAANSSLPSEHPQVGPWASNLAKTLNPLVGMSGTWVASWTESRIRRALEALGGLLVQGTGDPQVVSDAEATWRQLAAHHQTMLGLLQQAENQAAGWTSTVADGFRSAVRTTRDWLTAEATGAGKVAEALATAAAAVTASRAQLERTINDFIADLRRTAQANGAAWMQAAQDWTRCFEVDGQVGAAVYTALVPRYREANQAVERLKKQLSTVQSVLDQHGVKGKNPYTSWLKQGGKLGITAQLPRGLGAVVSVTEQKNGDGTFKHSYSLTGFWGADAAIKARLQNLPDWARTVAEKGLDLKDPATGLRISVGPTTGANVPGEFGTIPADAESAWKVGGFGTAKIVVPQIGKVGLDLTGAYNLTTGEGGFVGTADWKAKLGGVGLPSWETGGMVRGGWDSQQGWYGVGPYPLAQYTQPGASIPNFRVGGWLEYQSYKDTYGLDILDNAVINTAVPVVQSPAMAINTGWEYGNLQLSRLYTGYQAGDVVYEPPSTWQVVTGQSAGSWVTLTPQMQYDQALAEVQALQGLADQRQGWSDAGDQLSHGWTQGSGWVRNVRNTLWQPTQPTQPTP